MTDLSVNPGDMGREGANIFECADYIDRLLADHRAFRAGLGTPWGDGSDQFSREMNTVMPEAEEAFNSYLEFLAVAFRQTANNTLETARAFQNAEDLNLDESRRLVPRPGRR